MPVHQRAPAVIFGAGRTGRGLAARICASGGRPFVLVERDRALVESLRRAGGYPVEILGAGRETLRPAAVHAFDDAGWEAALDATDLAFTAVVGTNLPALGARLAPVLAQRVQPHSVVTCENETGAAGILATATGSPAHVGWVEGMVLTTCLAPGPGDDPLLVRSQDLLRLPCDRDAFIGAPPTLAGLDPLPAFGAQLRRKVFTYNAINAVISYVGAGRGHRWLADASRDPAVSLLAQQAGAEAGAALVAEFGFDPADQARWSTQALAKFADHAIPDPIARNAADPLRKLRPDDRLVGPARLAQRHGVRPNALAAGIAAAARYHDEGKSSPIDTHGSLTAVLTEVCGIATDDPLHALVLEADRG